jgi:hypothetical protein
MGRVLVFTALMLAGSSSVIYAQDGTKTPVTHNQTISANPLGFMFKWFNAEYERKLTESVTVGASASTFRLTDDDLQRFNALVRYYPQEAALTGAFIGARAGIARVDYGVDNANAFGIGVEIGYSWLFGAKRNVGLSIGGGVDRLFGGDVDEFPSVWPNLRLVNVGIAF